MIAEEIQAIISKYGKVKSIEKHYWNTTPHEVSLEELARLDDSLMVCGKVIPRTNDWHISWHKMNKLGVLKIGLRRVSRETGKKISALPITLYITFDKAI